MALTHLTPFHQMQRPFKDLLSRKSTLLWTTPSPWRSVFALVPKFRIHGLPLSGAMDATPHSCQPQRDWASTAHPMAGELVLTGHISPTVSPKSVYLDLGERMLGTII